MEVKNQVVHIPVMFVQSNALNLTINGQHAFSNKIDYKIKVNAGQVLLNKFRSHDRTLRPQKAKQNGWFNLYYQIRGHIDDYDIISNKRLVKADFIRSERRKREIQKELIEEFGNIKKIEEPIEWQDDKPVVNIDEIEFLDDLIEDDEEDNVVASTKPNSTKPIGTKPKPKPPVVKVKDEPLDDDVEYLEGFDDLQPQAPPKKKKDPKKKK